MKSFDAEEGRLLFQNDACMVINKRCGEDSEKLFGDGPGKPKLIHRLDTPASGCLLLAKTREAAAFLSDAFSQKSAGADSGQIVEKRYWAITEKPENDISLSKEWKEASHWISFNAAKNKSYAHNEERPGAKKALLRFRLAGQGDRYLFLEIELLTGRHHQIRAQLASLGLFIKGDLKYGARRSEKGGGIRLHARSLRFPNPLYPHESVLTEAPTPQDPLWEAFLFAF